MSSLRRPHHHRLHRRIAAAMLAVTALAGSPGPTTLAGEAAMAEWTAWGRDAGGTRHAPVADITPANVGSLSVAWTFRTGHQAEAEAAGRRFAFQATPILAEGRLYISTPFATVIALDPVTGRELWRADPGVDRSAKFSERKTRGVSFWRDPEAGGDAPCAARVLVGTPDGRLAAFDAANGAACTGFGQGGILALTDGIGPYRPGEYNITSPPAVVNGVIVVGSAIGDNGGVELEHGVVRGLDARTGQQIWAWDPIPRDPGAAASLGWDPEDAARVGAANVWAPIAADPARDLVFLPTGSASPDFFGGERLGDGKWANSIVALRASTGELVWGQQLVCHDLWDYDTPAQPVLMELDRDGATVPAVVQTTKMGLIFVFHRETGEPLFELVEKPVPASDVEGEMAAPTQRVPVAPPPLVSHDPILPEDAWGLTFWDKGRCEQAIAELRSEGIYTPPSERGTLMRPGYAGGSNWGGLSADPARGIVFANVNDLPTWVKLVRRDGKPKEELRSLPGSTNMAGTPFVLSRDVLTSPFGIPCTAPPWGTLAAVDLNSGTIRWQVPLGTTEELAPGTWFNWGAPNMGGSMTTASGLVFIAASMDDRIRAFAAETGEELWSAKLPAGGQATPMAYTIGGRSFVVIAAGGHNGLESRAGDYVVAFALPE